MTGRNKKPNRIEKNGNSIKVFNNSVYVGSITIRELGEYIKLRGRS